MICDHKSDETRSVTLPLPCHSFLLLSSQLYWRTRAEMLATQGKEIFALESASVFSRSLLALCIFLSVRLRCHLLIKLFFAWYNGWLTLSTEQKAEYFFTLRRLPFSKISCKINLRDNFLQWDCERNLWYERLCVNWVVCSKTERSSPFMRLFWSFLEL